MSEQVEDDPLLTPRGVDSSDSDLLLALYHRRARYLDTARRLSAVGANQCAARFAFPETLALDALAHAIVERMRSARHGERDAAAAPIHLAIRQGIGLGALVGALGRAARIYDHDFVASFGGTTFVIRPDMRPAELSAGSATMLNLPHHLEGRDDD